MSTAVVRSAAAALVVLVNVVQVSAPSVSEMTMYGRHWRPLGRNTFFSGSLRIGSKPGWPDASSVVPSVACRPCQ